MNIFSVFLLAVSFVAQQPTGQPEANAQPASVDPVQNELNTNKLKMPVGASSASFDLSDSARHTMIRSPNVLRISDQFQLTRQDTITMRGLMDLPMAALSEVVSKMNYYTQLRLLRFGLLQINASPQKAREYASKLYILTDEIFPCKAVQGSLNDESAALAERTDRKQLSQPIPQDLAPAVPPLENQPEVGSYWWPYLLVIVLAGAGAYYWFILQPKAIVVEPRQTDDQTDKELTEESKESKQENLNS